MDSFWTDFKAIAITSKNLPVQYEDDAIADVYRVFAVDGSVIYVCVIYKGTVPDNCGITQVQNDADKTDFETNYEPTANGRLSQGVTLDGSGFVSAIERATYAAEVAQAGANNRDMISIFNPSGSGKVIRVWEVWGTVPSSSGTSVIVPFEMRLATAITTGSTVTAGKYDQDDPDPSAVVRQLPTGITDHSTTPKLYTWVEQINTAQGSTDAHSHVVADPSATSRTKPIVLREGQGLYLRQIVNNTSTFRMGLYWTEE
jgi:hypothetical protein